MQDSALLSLSDSSRVQFVLFLLSAAGTLMRQRYATDDVLQHGDGPVSSVYKLILELIFPTSWKYKKIMLYVNYEKFIILNGNFVPACFL